MDETNLPIDHTIDLRGLPSDKLADRVYEALREATPGVLVEIIASDRPALAERVVSDAAGFDLLEASQFGTVFRFVFRKRAPRTDDPVLRG